MREELLERGFIRNLDWLIRSRWIAAAGTFLIVTGARFVLKIDLPILPLYLGVMILLIYNLLFLQYSRRLKSQMGQEGWLRRANRFANIQISLDLFLVTYLIYFSGGVENSFMFYFIFHMVIASILLSNRAAYLQASLAIILLTLMAMGERLGYLPHHHLNKLMAAELYDRPYYLIVEFFVFISTLYLTVYMATFIVNRLRERERELAALNEQLAEQDRLKSQYVLTVSHDLAAALATIRNYLEALLDGLAGPMPESIKRVIAKVERRTSHLLQFVRDLLDLSRIRARREFPKERFSLIGVINKVIDQLKAEIEGKNLSVDLRFPRGCSQIYANYNGIEEMFANLIGNAVRYTPPSGTIGIKIAEVKPECFHVMVWDTGIGIPQEDLEKIFEEFYRTRNAEEMIREGTGLGLPIVKEILKAHEGEIWVESRLGEGSRFVFTISNRFSCPDCPDKRKFPNSEVSLDNSSEIIYN
jgi:signal transduction histidine kinase